MVVKVGLRLGAPTEAKHAEQGQATAHEAHGQGLGNLREGVLHYADTGEAVFSIAAVHGDVFLDIHAALPGEGRFTLRIIGAAGLEREHVIGTTRRVARRGSATTLDDAGRTVATHAGSLRKTEVRDERSGAERADSKVDGGVRRLARAGAPGSMKGQADIGEADAGAAARRTDCVDRDLTRADGVGARGRVGEIREQQIADLAGVPATEVQAPIAGDAVATGRGCQSGHGSSGQTEDHKK